MRRHHIRIGDKTTANGVVVSAASNFMLLDKQVATEGDKIACRGCRSTGTIICIGPRHPEYYEGRQVALEGDLCVCRCPRHPKLIPSQSVRFQDVEGSYAEAMSGPPKIDPAAQVVAASKEADDLEQLFVMLDEQGNPITGMAYRIDGGKEKLRESVLGSAGATDAFPMNREIDAVFWRPLGQNQ